MLQVFTRRATNFRSLALSLALAGAAALPAAAQTVYGLSITSNIATVNLVTFSATAPGTFTATVPITGFTAGQAIVGIDVRPNTGELFALGYNPTGTQAQLYTLNRTTGVATAIGAALTLNLGTTTSRIGFDFNPAVDRIRVTSAARTNFRLNPNNGALTATDGTLTYATGDANAAQTPGVGSSAYTNSYIGSTATTLYNLDETNSRLVTQNPPNDGTLNTVGALGVATSGVSQASDLDIYYNPTTGANVAYMTSATSTSSTAATSTLYTVNLATGAATAVGALGSGTLVAVTDIAVAIDRTVPATVTGQLAYALAGPNLLTFDTSVPGTIRTSVGVTGVDASQTLVGLDVRPANNALYALGYNNTAATGVANSQLYTINAVTGVATPLGAAVRLELSVGGNVGFDFNPTVDRIRVVGINRTNYRLNPVFGAASVLAATDGSVTYSTGTAQPTIGAVAYTNSFTGSTTTTLYNYDVALNQLNTQATANPPADGQLTPVGNLGVAFASPPTVDLDIYSPATGTNTAYLIANTGTSLNTSLYTVNLTTGAATLVGAIGNGIAARNIAIAVPTGVATGTKAAELAADLSLYPNPLAGSTQLSFTLPRTARVELTVTDALGRAIDHLDAGQLPAGPQAIRWARRSQAAGVYFFRLRFDGQPAGTRQAVLTE